MAIITKPSSMEKGTEYDFTLNISDLLAHANVSGDAYFSTQSNWNRVILHYDSAVGNQPEVLVFENVDSGDSDTASFGVHSTARDIFEIQSVTIRDKQNGYLRIDRDDLVSADFDVDFSTPTSTGDGFSSTLKSSNWSVTNNYTASNSSTDPDHIFSNSYIEDGYGTEKVYMEFTLDSEELNPGGPLNQVYFGFHVTADRTVQPGNFSGSLGLKADTSLAIYVEKNNNRILVVHGLGSQAAFSAGFTIAEGDTVMMALDTVAQKVYMGINGVWNIAESGDPTTEFQGIDISSYGDFSNQDIFYGAYGSDMQVSVNETAAYTVPDGYTHIR